MKIIAIGAHIDDIELGAGGLLADAALKHHVVKMIIMSKSGYSDFSGKVSRTNEQAQKEGIAAARTLGITDCEILDFPIKSIPYSAEPVEALDRIITLYKPDLIITQWPYDTHQDHRNTALSTISAARYYNNILMYEPIWPSGRSYQGFRGQLYYRVSRSAVTKKTNAIKQHKSQHNKYGEPWVNTVTARGMFRGGEVGCAYAECFEVVRWELKL